MAEAFLRKWRKKDAAIRDAVLAKAPGHGMADPGYRYRGRPMSMIGG